jgi:hypothetical protein
MKSTKPKATYYVRRKPISLGGSNKPFNTIAEALEDSKEWDLSGDGVLQILKAVAVVSIEPPAKPVRKVVIL